MSEVKKAWKVQWSKMPDIESYVAGAGTASKIRYRAYLNIGDSYRELKITELRITRAPQFDHLAAKVPDNHWSSCQLGYVDHYNGDRFGCCEEVPA